MVNEKALRAQLARTLDWDEAHVGFGKALDGIPADRRGARAAGFEHSPWQLLEHMRIGQEDILDFCVNPVYVHNRKWPDDYWPNDPAPPTAQAWNESVSAFKKDCVRLQELARDEKIDLLSTVPTGTGHQTYLRALLLVLDHNAYHVGQLVAVRRALGTWT